MSTDVPCCHKIKVFQVIAQMAEPLFPHSFESTFRSLGLPLFSYVHMYAILHAETKMFFDITVAATKVIRLRELAYLKVSRFIFAES